MPDLALNKPRTLQEYLKAFDQAMGDEGVPDQVREKVIHRLIWGSSSPRPDGSIPPTINLA